MDNKNQNKNEFKPINGHYGLEFALQHIDKDITEVIEILEKEKKIAKS